ncbi:hypothetical protein [Echinicola sp. 20G]|uniref:hypothetical protein n=1 Tax=Echinicola sp. 20G TaxID=2781961 RepID=UPI0019103DB0|nr:hypothetical protein [Echinicola sp. 20G]
MKGIVLLDFIPQPIKHLEELPQEEKNSFHLLCFGWIGKRNRMGFSLRRSGSQHGEQNKKT